MEKIYISSSDTGEEQPPAGYVVMTGTGLWVPPYRTSTNGYLGLGNPAAAPLKYRVAKKAVVIAAFLLGVLVGTYGLIAFAR